MWHDHSTSDQFPLTPPPPSTFFPPEKKMVKKLTRGIKACTNCRQQKIRCDASETLPAPCRRCAKMGKECIIDPEFKPRKGSQVDILREEMAALKRQMAGLNPAIEKKVKLESLSPEVPVVTELPSLDLNVQPEEHTGPDQHIKLPSPTAGPYSIDNVRISDTQAAELHSTFVQFYLPMMPIVETNSCGELYSQSETLFWTVMFIASLSNPTPELYLRLVDPLKRLVVKSCYLETPRSTHVVQALVLLATWNMPNEKVSDDPSYRYLTLARSIAMQLGLHRGKFIYEFTRKQKLMPNAVKWRTRTWTWIYVSEQVLSAVLGVPSNMRVDFLIEEAMNPEREQQENAQVRLWAWYSNMALLMGSSTRTPDGLLNSRVRMPSIEIFAQDLDRMGDQLPREPSVRITLEYCRLLLYIYAFLPGTTETDQSSYICPAFESATRLITLSRQFVGKRRISEFPTQIRQATTFAAFLLFKLHALPQFPSKWLESARQSIVTVHHLYRNISHGWSSVPNDVTRAAKILESLNVVLINHPELLTGSSIMVTHMRSHLSYSLFYEIIWTIHEARRRTAKATKQNVDLSSVPQPLRGPEIAPENVRTLPPLPLFNQISSEEYASSTYTSPNGTTMTTLVPAARNISQAPATAAPVPETVQTDVDELLQGIDWMSHEGDDFLGWVPNGEFLI